MLYSKTTRLMILTISTCFFIGCGGDSSSTTKINSKATEEIPLSSFNTITETVTEDISVTLQDSKDMEIEIKISEGTQFIDIESNEVTSKTPTIKVSVSQGSNISLTSLSFNIDDKEIIPTEPIAIAIPAPLNAKEGDSVNLTISDNSKNSNKIVEKLISVVVGADGRIHIVINQNSFIGQLFVEVLFNDSSTN